MLLRSLPLIALTALLVGCGAPSAAEGTFEGEAFAVQDSDPEVRQRAGGVTIVLSEEAPANAERPEGQQNLWLVILTLPEGMRLEEGTPIALGPKGSDMPSLDVAVGELTTFDVEGRKVANTKAPRFVSAESGTISFWSVDKLLAGEFEAHLEGGDFVKGSFEVDLEQAD